MCGACVYVRVKYVVHVHVHVHVHAHMGMDMDMDMDTWACTNKRLYSSPGGGPCPSASRTPEVSGYFIHLYTASRNKVLYALPLPKGKQRFTCAKDSRQGRVVLHTRTLFTPLLA